MAQHNLIKFCLEKRTKRFRKQFSTRKYAEQELKGSLKEFLFQKIKEKVDACNVDQETQKSLLAERGEQVLKKMDSFDDFREYTIDVDFDHSLLIWHIATCICDLMKGNHHNDFDKFQHELSISLSEYMSYLLVECPQMLPTLSGHSFYLDTCEHAKIIFREKPELAEDFKSGQTGRLDLETFIKETQPGFHKTEDVGKYSSQLNLGFKLAQKLQSKPNKWDLISEMWIEKLIYAASHADWRHHAQRLVKGGELLAHLALLMAHVGFSQHSKLSY